MKLVEITIPSAMDLTKREVRPAVFSAMIRINKIIAEFGAERNIDLTDRHCRRPKLGLCVGCFWQCSVRPRSFYFQVTGKKQTA